MATGWVLVETASVTVGGPIVLVGMTGTVGGLRIAAWVRLASTVWAAAVKTASAPCVGVAFEGRLQAEMPNTRVKRIEASRVILNILSSSIQLHKILMLIVSQAGENVLFFMPPKTVNTKRLSKK